MTTEFRPLTKEDIAQVLGVSLRTVENWVNDGTLVAPGKIGSRVYWHPRSFYEWLDRTLSATAGCAAAAEPMQVAGAPEPLPASRIPNPKGTKTAKEKAESARLRGEAKLQALLS